MKQQRIDNIISDLETYEISSYEIEQNTSLTRQAVDNIRNGKSENPHSKSLREIETYIGVNYRDENKISRLVNECIENWEELKTIKLFQKQLEIEVLNTINQELKNTLEEFKK